ncbi:MAG: universal stress protein [Gemmatirosa sp.]
MLLLAADASPAARAAIRIGHAREVERGAAPSVVYVFDTGDAALPGPLSALLAFSDELVGPDVHAPDVQAVRSVLTNAAGKPVSWPIQMGIGTPATVILRRAATLRAAMVVMGLRRHGLVDQVLHDETTLNVMRAAACPVLGVTSELTALPDCAVVGMDFGAASVTAARCAAQLLAPGGRLVLAYVDAGGHDPDADTGDEVESTIRQLGLDASFNRATAAIDAPASIAVERVTTTADGGRSTADALRATADERGATLIAVGRHRRSLLDRLLLGSVARDLARAGTHSLLVAPPPAST